MKSSGSSVAEEPDAVQLLHEAAIYTAIMLELRVGIGRDLRPLFHHPPLLVLRAQHSLANILQEMSGLGRRELQDLRGPS